MTSSDASPTAPTLWAKSSYSGQHADCVEWRRAPHGAGIQIGDSKHRGSSTLTVTADAWTALVAFARHPELAIPRP
jgi:hypothetical protein